jgi:uncharacterized protein YlaN (UPF0358 family)
MDRKSYGQKLKLKMWAIKIELKFYEKLFKSEGCDKDAGKKLLQNLNKKLDDEG